MIQLSITKIGMKIELNNNLTGCYTISVDKQGEF